MKDHGHYKEYTPEDILAMCEHIDYDALGIDQAELDRLAARIAESLARPPAERGPFPDLSLGKSIRQLAASQATVITRVTLALPPSESDEKEGVG